MAEWLNMLKQSLASVALFAAGVVAATVLLFANPLALPAWLDLLLYAAGVAGLLAMTIEQLFAK